MAKRVGKYKISKREAALSLSEGQVFSSTLTSAGAATFSGTFGATGAITPTGAVTGSVNESDGHGAGAIGTEVAPVKSIITLNDQIITTIKLDLTGLKAYNDDGDIIGKDATDGAYLLQYVTATHGILYKAEISCIELPTASSNVCLDFDLSLVAAADGAGNDDANAGITVCRSRTARAGQAESGCARSGDTSFTPTPVSGL